MDISTLNTVKPAEIGAFMHLRHPVTKELLYHEAGGKKEPVGLTLRGNESSTVQKALKKVRRDAAQAIGKHAKEAAETSAGLAYAKSLLISFHHCYNGVEPLSADNASDIEWFFEQSSDFVTQVTTFAQDRENFFKASETS